MTEALLVRTPSGALAPADDDSRNLIASLKVGQPVRAKLSQKTDADDEAD